MADEKPKDPKRPVTPNTASSRISGAYLKHRKRRAAAEEERQRQQAETNLSIMRRNWLDGGKSRRGGRKSRRGGRKSRKGGRMRTRASLKRAQKSYRRRRKASQCRGKGPAVCRSKPGCKYASGKKRRFCRNKKSTRRARR